MKFTARSKSSPFSSEMTTSLHYNHDASESSTIQDYASPKVKSFTERTMDGEDIFQFHRLKAKGRLIPYTNFSQVEVSGSATGDYSYTNTTSGDSQWFEGNHPYRSEWILSAADAKTIAQELLPEAHELVSSSAGAIYSTGWDALTFIAELKQTVGLFHNIAKRFADILARRDAASAWLEYRYGWRQLMFDIIDIDKALHDFDSKRKRYKQRVGMNKDYTYSSNTISEDPIHFSAEYLVETVVSASLRGSVIADISPPRIRFDPITTAWEKIPYSFVIDWFVQVGSWLNAMNFLTLQREYYAAAGVYATITRTLEQTSFASKPSYSVSRNCTGTSVAQVTLRERSTVQLSPTVKLNLDWLKGLDALALIKKALLN